MATQQEIETLLAQAKSAYHSLVTGTMARVIVDKNGERVEFAASAKGELYSYIRTLESQLPSAVAAPTRGPAQFWF